VIQRKTGKKLEIESPLRRILDRCRDEVLSPFIIHRLPEKLRPRGMRAKSRVHHTQVLLEQAEREFDHVERLAAFISAQVARQRCTKSGH